MGVAAESAGMRDVRHLQSIEEASEALLRELQEGDFLLIKASRAIGLEAVAGALVVR
jgi:UDP-N-acetylmuramyl pentapeptide synthase